MIARLNAVTAEHHTAADSDFAPLFAQDVAAADYLVFLMRAYGFEAPVEAMLAMTPGLDLSLRTHDRGKAHYLAQDLAALGIRPHEIAELPQCLAIPQFRGSAEALGWMYVIERHTLSHSVLKGHLTSHLPRETRVASAYLSAHEGRVGARWGELGETLDRIATQPAIAERVISAAHDAFSMKRRWYRQGPSGIRHAEAV